MKCWYRDSREFSRNLAMTVSEGNNTDQKIFNVGETA